MVFILNSKKEGVHIMKKPGDKGIREGVEYIAVDFHKVESDSHSCCELCDYRKVKTINGCDEDTCPSCCFLKVVENE
jgi:hypothetical protein